LWRITLQEREKALPKYTTEEECQVAVKTALMDLKPVLCDGGCHTIFFTNLEKFFNVVDRFLSAAPFPASLTCELYI